MNTPKTRRKKPDNLIRVRNQPEVLTIRYGKTTTTLSRINDDEGAYYVGRPINSHNGSECLYALIVGSDGEVSGTAAMNFIANQGWRVGDTKPTAEEMEEAMKEFVASFQEAKLYHYESENSGVEELKEFIESVSGLRVEDGEMTEEDLRLISLVDIQMPDGRALNAPYSAVQAAKSRGLRILVDPARHARSFVSPKYARCVEGDWDDESANVALTSALPMRKVQFMKCAGLKFRKMSARAYNV